MAEKVVSVRLQAKVEGFTAGMRKAKASVDDLTKAAAPSKTDAFGKMADKAALAGVGVATAVGVAVKRFADFDQAMSAVQANSGATGSSLDSLREAAIKMGADSQFSAKEAADGINEMAKAGVSTADILGGGLKGAMDLAAAGQISVADAAETAATAMTQFKLSGDKMPHIADLMANAANKAQGGVGDMAQALKQAGLVAASTGLSIDETTAGLTAFAAAGLLGSDAGTSMKTMLQRLSAPAGEAKQLMDELNISAYDSKGNFVGLSNVAGQLTTAMDKMTPAQRNAAMATIFGSDAVRAANVLYTEGAEGINRWTREVTEQGAAAKQAATLTDNLKGDVERLGGALDSVFIQSGSGANGALRGLTQGVTGLVDKISNVPGPVLLAGGALASFALLAPKGVLKYREYAKQLDTLGLSMDKISTKAPKTGKALNAVGTAAKALAAAATAAAVLGNDMGELGTARLQADLLKSKDGAEALNKAINDLNKSGFGNGATNVRDFGDVLRYTFDPSFMDEAAHSAEGVLGIFGVEQTNDISVASNRLREIDATLASMVQSGAATQAADLFKDLTTQAASQGVSVDELKAKMPGYAEALAGVSNAAANSVQPQSEMAESTDKIKKAADDAKDALDALHEAISGLGSPLAAQRAAGRDFQEAIDKAAASVKENGKTLDDQSEKGRANAAALDDIRDKTLAKVQADFDAVKATKGTEAATAAATKAMKDGQQAFIDAAIAAGMAAPEAKKLADNLGLVPKDVKILVEQSGAAEAEAAIDKAARDRVATIRVATRIANERDRRQDAANSDPVRKATGGAIYGPGTGTSDSIHALLSNGEHVWTAAEVKALGGQGAMYALRAAVRSGNLPRYADGGAVASRFAPVQLMAPASSTPGGLGRQFVTGSLDLGDGLRGFVRAIVADEVANGGRRAALRSM